MIYVSIGDHHLDLQQNSLPKVIYVIIFLAINRILNILCVITVHKKSSILNTALLINYYFILCVQYINYHTIDYHSSESILYIINGMDFDEVFQPKK